MLAVALSAPIAAVTISGAVEYPKQSMLTDFPSVETA